MTTSFLSPLDSVPMPTGPYQVGTTKYDLVDEWRKELQHPKGRLIPIQIYFPMLQGRHVAHSKIFEESAPTKWGHLDVLVYSRRADLSLMIEGIHPLILLNPGTDIAMTDYASISEDLASHGYVVVAIQHSLKTDAEEPQFWKERTLSRLARIIDNLLYVFQWLKANQNNLFHQKIDLMRVGCIGHSSGGNALLLLACRASNKDFKESTLGDSLFFRDPPHNAQECCILLETSNMPYPHHHRYPLFFLFAEKRESYQKKSGIYDELTRLGYQVRYYEGAGHLSFMDHGYFNPPPLFEHIGPYFNGTAEERKAFFELMRKEIRDFLKVNIGV
jgi:dienelactone hydrolase